ncbi:protein transport protein SEC20 [Clonorchis sinensis]|uniref:Protein transport protein SEC20 n=1 Tax=Clonorchis sinensis TaxID=79923 RepID=H2KU14_CLOSI|nr:protein transport protein SEC20 [Clonorchis sinensis]
MPRNPVQVQFEKLLNLDARTKELIASIEKISSDAGDVKYFREQLDIYQDEVKSNISSMNAILDELQYGKVNCFSYTKVSDLRQSISYNREQLSFLQDSYRKAIFKALRHLESMEREHLIRRPLNPSGDPDVLNSAFETSMELTRDMTAHARRLAEEVKLGALNAELLEDSSSQITSNYAELREMSGQMGQSRRLTSLAYRRRLTSYVLYSLAFTFYFFSVAAIFLNRVPLGSWFLPSSYL